VPYRLPCTASSTSSALPLEYRQFFCRASPLSGYIEGHASGVAADYGRYPIATLREAIESVPADPLCWELE
jgi:hypothetical protein